MQTLPITTQTVASKSTSTRTVNSGSDTSDFLPTLNKAEAKTSTRAERSDSTRETKETTSRHDAKTQKQDDDYETRQSSRKQDSEDSVVEESSSDTTTDQRVAQKDETSDVAEQKTADDDTSDDAGDMTDAVVAVAAEVETVNDDALLVTEELQGTSTDDLVAESDVTDDVIVDQVGPRVHDEQRQQVVGPDRAAEVKAAQATEKSQAAAVQNEGGNEEMDDALLAQKIKEQLVQPTSIKAESVQVAAQSMAQMKQVIQTPVEVVDGIEGLNAQSEEPTGKITDPRFASLLNRQDVETVLRQRQTPAQVAANPNGLAANGSDSLAESLLNATSADGDDAVQMTTAKPNAALDALLQRAGADGSVQSDAQAAVAHTPHQQTTATTSTFALGQRQPVNVPDSHIVNQTVEHLSIHARGESSTVTVRLHPEELGELQLRMVMEGDQLKVHLHAQSQQVQDVLERNFPRLRDALQDQGLTVEDFQVSVDSGNAEQQQSFSQHGQNNGRGSVAVAMDADMMAQVAEVVPGVAIDSSQGISVRI
nr:flagellar hook-length control protein FliK [uncultured Desulfuromonas sp.]